MAAFSPFDRSQQVSRSIPHADPRLYDTFDDSQNKVPAEVVEAFPRHLIATDRLTVQRHNATSAGASAVAVLLSAGPEPLNTEPYEFALPGDARPPVDFQLKQVATSWQARHYTYQNLSCSVPQRGFGGDAGGYGIYKEASRLLIQGNPAVNPQDVSSLDYTIGTLGLGTAVASSGNALRDLDRARSNVTALDGAEARQSIYIGNLAAWRQILEAYRGVGQAPEFKETRRDGEIRLHHCGLPFYINDFIAVGAGDVTTVYCLLLDTQVGCCLIANENAPDPVTFPTNESLTPYVNLTSEWNIEFVSMTDRALAAITSFPALV